MKSKQLANVLIKMLGLSVCLYSIPNFVSGIFFALSTLPVSKSDIAVMRIFSSAVGAAVQAVVGIVVISLSGKIAGLLFESDDE